MMAQENGVYPMKRSRETKGVTSQITPTAKARALLRITSATAAVVYGYAVNTLENRLKAKSVSYAERQRATITRFTTLTNSKISKARNGGKSQ